MLSNSELNAKQYYHGNDVAYVKEQLRKHGKYMHDLALKVDLPIAVTSNFKWAERYALFAWDRSKMTPVVLIIDGDAVRERVKEASNVSSSPCIDYLLESEFMIKEIKL
ncbi:MAG: hypothetical protein WC755_02495 [Candidatus Woesearchaeota archaeon]|jgi:hypothetical protein